METEHSNTLVSEFLKRPSRSTLTQCTKADLIDLGWSKPDKVPKKAELRGIVEGLAVSARPLEVVQASTAPGPVGSVLFGSTLSLEHYLQLEWEKSELEKEKL